jgi:aminoglycoside phosphotransferase (APT) family kinase protein
MLSPSDADLIRREPALPGLATLLDTEAFVTALRRSLPEAELGAAQITYIRYKPGMNCLVAYRLEAAGAPVEVYAKTYGPDAEVQLQNARQRSSVSGPLGPGRIVLEDGAIVVSFFPNDGRLKALPRLADVEARNRLLRKLIPDRPDLWEGTIRRLAYKPERRYVARLLAREDAGAVIRVYTGPGYRAARMPARALASRGPLRLARWLGGSDRRHILAFDWLSGRLLSEAMLESELELEAVVMVGAALAEFHTQNPNGLTFLTRAAEAETLLTVAAGLGVVCPHLATRAHDLARRLAARIVDEPRVNGPIHGDFYAKQVLLTDDAVAILDLDRATAGDPAADLGNFIAHLKRDALRGHLAPNRVEPLREALLEGYRAATPHSLPARIELYTAAGLLRLAPDPFRHREPNWPERIEAILERIEAMADGGWRMADGKILKSKIQNPKSKIEVIDPFGVTADPKMSFLAQALDPRVVQQQFERCLTNLTGEKGQISLRAIRVARHKPGRRCLIEYDVHVERPDAPAEAITLIGKARARGLDESTFRLLKAFWETGFGADSEDGVCVPEPVGVTPAFQLWLQRKVSGVVADALLAEPGGEALASRIAEAIHKLHRSGILPHRHHTMADELRILHERLAMVARARPPWANRLERLLNACDRLGATISPSSLTGIHRDFYHDHVIVSGPRLYLLDFDLYCAGDPGLDAGNFLGHITEQSLRATGEADSLRDKEEALEERFVELSGERVRRSVRAYATLTLVRHIYLSTQFAERRPFTEPLLELCEQRLGVAERAYV